MARPALVLFAHGARDAAWAEPFLRLRELVRARRPDARVELAFLELMAPRLTELVPALAAEGCQQVHVVPVFLAQGGHVQRDVPALLEQLRAAHPGLQITLAPAVGENGEVQEALARYCAGVLD